jgi:hypothetical protein
MSFFKEIQLKEIQYNFEDAFKLKDLNVSEFVLNEEDNSCKFLVNKKDRIKVDLSNKKWKLNGLDKGEIFGKSVTDVSGDYLYECSKDR